MKKTMLTWDTLDRFEAEYNVATLTPEQIKEAEHLAYCANMGANSTSAAWIRFCELCEQFLKIKVEG